LREKVGEARMRVYRATGTAIIRERTQHTLIRPSGTFSRKREKGIT
jgi:hypothetical protein